MAMLREDFRPPTQQDIEKAQEAAIQLSHDGILNPSLVPPIALKLIQNILDELSHGNMVAVQKIEQFLSTTEAAELLNVSRPYVIKLLNEGKLPFHTVGSHRRIRYDELMQYKKKQEEQSYQLMAELQAEAQELNMGYE
jgi:excisionase family DNA binding protein